MPMPNPIPWMPERQSSSMDLSSAMVCFVILTKVSSSFLATSKTALLTGSEHAGSGLRLSWLSGVEIKKRLRNCSIICPQPLRKNKAKRVPYGQLLLPMPVKCLASMKASKKWRKCSKNMASTRSLCLWLFSSSPSTRAFLRVPSLSGSSQWIGTLWYALNQIGGKAAWAEAAGPWAHYQFEEALGEAVEEKQCKEAAKALRYVLEMEGWLPAKVSRAQPTNAPKPGSSQPEDPRARFQRGRS